MNTRTFAALLLSASVGFGALALAGAFGSAVAGDRPGGPEATGMNGKALTPEEERVIVHKGTERPFSGKLLKNHDKGVYTCKRCGAPLFPSSAKFDSGTGWPSFDDALPGAVREIPDADGLRTEIVCARCGAHLGHVFRGEGFTAKDTRNCVNSVSLDFVPAAPGEAAGDAASPGPAVSPTATTSAGTCSPDDGPGAVPKEAVAYFAGGCFWGVEYWFDKEPGVIQADSGYMGGHVDHPTYEQVSDHGTGHLETVRVVYDPSKTTYQKLATLFFDIHDPTQEDGQGPDIGPQYKSVVFYADQDQKRIAASLIERLQRRGLKVATRLAPATTFWRAEEYHQDHYAHRGTTPYCHAREDRFGGE